MMSGKNLIKRKREGTAHCSQNPTKLAKQNDNHQQEPPTSTKEDVPYPTEEEDNVASTRRQILLEALKRIMELQSELDDFENDLDANAYYKDDSWHEQQQQQQEEEEAEEVLAHRRSEAEALGFAMCARETLTFLQREGIPSDSLIYRTLKDTLTGQSDDVLPI